MRTRILDLVVVVGLGGALGGCEPPPLDTQPPRGDIEAPWEMPLRPFCGGSYAFQPAVRGHLEGDELVEVSGVVASPSNPGVLWMHNDSGDAARLFAVGTDGAFLGELALEGVEAVDIEDIAAAPCPDASGPCLWVADIGDNRAERSDAIVYAVPEPAVGSELLLGNASMPPGWSFPLSYPDGPIDSEALVVLPDGSAFVVIEKTAEREARVYRTPAPLVDGVPLELLEIGRFPTPGVDIEHGRKVTGADLHPSGRALVVRVYTGVFEYWLSSAEDLAILDEIEPVTVAFGPLSEPQGEAVAYDDIGLGLWTVSEDPEGNGGQPMHHYPCQ